MHAFVVSHYGEPARLAEVAEPTVGDHDVLVEVGAAGVNALDEKIRLGELKLALPYRLPVVLGNDVAGTVIGVGAKVRSFQIGDEVFGRPHKDRIGTFAERIAVAEGDLALRPRSVSVVEAASLPLVALTAWQALVERGHLQPGQRALIHAGAGGVGSVAIQLAKHLGATVATTVSSGNVDFARELGADVVIDYASEDFEELLEGYDLVLDSVGGDTLERSLRVLRPGGKAIGIAGPPDAAFAREAGAGLLVRLAMTALSSGIRRQARRLGVTYEFLFMHASGDQLRQIADLVDGGALRPVVGRVFEFDETVQALQSITHGGSRGKTVVTRPPSPRSDQPIAARHTGQRRAP